MTKPFMCYFVPTAFNFGQRKQNIHHRKFFHNKFRAYRRTDIIATKQWRQEMGENHLLNDKV